MTKDNRTPTRFLADLYDEMPASLAAVTDDAVLRIMKTDLDRYRMVKTFGARTKPGKLPTLVSCMGMVQTDFECKTSAIFTQRAIDIATAIDRAIASAHFRAPDGISTDAALCLISLHAQILGALESLVPPTEEKSEPDTAAA